MKKYSKSICNWSCFQNDKLNPLIEHFQKVKVDKKFCIPDLLIKDTIYCLLNYVGCNSLLAFLFFFGTENLGKMKIAHFVQG